VEERCEGRLRMTPTGEGGFGYDPIFVPEEFVDDPAASFATLSAEAKDRLSHRGKALRKLVAAMRAVLLG
jgi:XTP/dITP diphosphohydrolase